MFKAVEFEWITSLEEGEHSPAAGASSSGVPSCVTHVTNRAEEVDFARWQWLVRLFPRCGRVSPSSLQRAQPWRQAELAGGQGEEGGDGNFPGRVIKETEQALVPPSTSKCSNVRPKCPVLSHDSTFANISNICFPLCSFTCHHPAPTNTSSSLFKHSLMRKYCYNEPQLKPGMKIKLNTGIAGKRKRVQNRSCKEKQGQEQLQWLPGAPRGEEAFRY